MRLPRGLVVSCQARADNPLHGPQFMGAMALAARDGGAVGIRANGPADIAAVKAAGLPVIGIHKVFSEQYPVYITPDFAAAEAIVAAGAEVVALDCTERPRDGEPPAVLIRRIRDELGAEVFADISTLREGLAAADWGAHYVATTLSGYTEATEPKPEEPDLRLLEALARKLAVPVVAEGRYNSPELVRQGFEAGAHAVVVGTMITNPREITRAFVKQGVPA
ncbi:N-acetylmannosamine-6-phosphate 2-epimerase [Devosia sp. 63-57]|uniref:N-acetylmannosamine-6-phosphate 2-epimerase n=1 Tax=Devosia sp. 63-57 TaxID=1895751 RepID=UPI000868C79C|nr:N-acetylmannosamine-6-phosphate 2-epimerase [Devosia sp. 63-57]ODT50881.1 MAG: N-acetylmannosamine-6-phosphate 2-epimerase [Pelagibacterium sp. SCN 63-126]ODU80532.1 MAG: N-acetylmannosamine-6-phosphate 2-epimerase [Pelagibacterium sp. SCN 63-17]OJX44458.1 MAG: N-acetylmannosamine-6-phosphate 2-epimerase [Devosia sp. 63-57]